MSARWSRVLILIGVPLGLPGLGGSLAPLPAAASLAVEATLDRSEIEPMVEAALLRVTVRSSGLKLAEPPPPAIPGLQVRPAGSAHNVSLIQGRVERSVTLLYRVSGAREGRYTIPPIVVSLGRERAASAPLSLTIRRGGRSSAAAGRREVPPPQDIPPMLPEAFAGASVDRSQAYWNEPILLTLRFYSRVRLLEEPDWKPPEVPGFWIEELGTPVTYTMRHGGLEYAVLEVRSALFPTRTGRLRIGSSRIRCRIGRVKQPPDPWSALAVPEVVPEDLVLQTRPLEIDVKSLPPGAPASFAGAVGDFRFGIHVDRRRARVGEPVTLTTRVEGEGNIASVRDPAVAVPPGFRSYETGSSVRLEREGQRLRGERTRHIAVVADRVGEVVIPPVSFTWFDPESGRYRVQQSDSVRVPVLPGEIITEAGGRGDSLPLPPRAERRRAGGTGSLALDPPAGAVALAGASLVLFAGSLLWADARDRRARDPIRARRNALRRLVTVELARARGLARAGDAAGATAAAREALLAGVEVRFAVSASGRPAAELWEEASTRGLDRTEREALETLLLALERSAYAPPDVRGGDVTRSLDAVGERLARYGGDV